MNFNEMQPMKNEFLNEDGSTVNFQNALIKSADEKRANMFKTMMPIKNEVVNEDGSTGALVGNVGTGGGGVSEHDLLSEASRSLPNQHSMEAITGLTNSLATKMPINSTGEDIPARVGGISITDHLDIIESGSRGLIGAVATFEDLPTIGEYNGDQLLVLDTKITYLWIAEYGAWYEYVNPNSFSNVYTNTPIGEIVSYMGVEAPASYLICDGSEYSISSYQELADHFLNNFGSYDYFGGDGETTFAVPDLRDEFLRGYHGDNSTQYSGEIGEHQDATDVPWLAQNTSYNRIYRGYSTTEDDINANLPLNYESKKGGELGYIRFSGTRTVIAGVGDSYGAESMTTRPRNVAVLFCIKYSNENGIKLNQYYKVLEQIYTDAVLTDEEVKELNFTIDDTTAPNVQKIDTFDLHLELSRAGGSGVVGNLTCQILQDGIIVANFTNVEINRDETINPYITTLERFDIDLSKQTTFSFSYTGSGTVTLNNGKIIMKGVCTIG